MNAYFLAYELVWSEVLAMLSFRLDYCELCSKLHDDSEPVKEYADMFEWFYYANKTIHMPACRSPWTKKYYRSVRNELGGIRRVYRP